MASVEAQPIIRDTTTAAGPVIRDTTTAAQPVIRETASDPTEAQAVIRLDSGPAVSAAEQPRVYRGGTFTRGVSRGIEQSQGLAGQLLSLIGDTTGLAGLVDIGDELVQEAFVEAVSNPARIGGFEDIEGIGDFTEFIKQTLGEQAFNIALAATGGGIGALLAKKAVSKAALRELAKKSAPVRGPAVTREQVLQRFFNTAAGKKAVTGGTLKGAAAGTFGAFLPINTGEIIQEQRDAHEAYVKEAGGDYWQAEDYVGKPELGPSLVLGAASSALEVLGFGLIGKAVFGQAKKEVIDHTLGMVLARTGHTTLKALAAEGGTEAVQEAMVIASRKINDPTFSIGDAIASSEGLSRIAFAGVSGAVVGGVLGGAGGVTTGAVQSAQLGMHRAKLKAETLPGVDALKSLSEADQGEEVTSLFDLGIARKNMTTKFREGKAKGAEMIQAAKNALLKEEDKAAAAATAEEYFTSLQDDMSIEDEGLNTVEEALGEYEGRIGKALDALRRVIAQLPRISELDKEQNAAVRADVETINTTVKEARALQTKNPAKAAENMIELATRIASRALANPANAPVAKLEKMLNEAEKYAERSLGEKRGKLHTAKVVLEKQQAAIERQRAKIPKVAAEPKMSTPVKETLASLDEVQQGNKRATFIRGETNPNNLDKAVRTAIAARGLVPRPDPANDRVVVVRKEDSARPLRELERADFATPIDAIQDPVVVTRRNKAGEVIQNEAVERDSDAVAEAVQRGEQAGAATEVRATYEATAESISETVAEAQALELGLTIGQVNDLVDEQSTIYVRMPNSNRLMPAIVTLDDTLVREDGKKFRLFDTEEEIEKSKALKTSKEKFEDFPVETVKVGKKFALRVRLPGTRTASKDRQMRRAVRRGNDTPNKARYAIQGVKNGKKIWLHLGEITKLGLMDEAGETIKNRSQPNAQTAFLTGLSTLITEYGVSIDFNPTVHGGKAIYGNTTYKNAGYYQDEIVTGFSETDFADWVMEELAQGNLTAEDISQYLWNAGNALSEQELTKLLQETRSTEGGRTSVREIEALIRDNVEGIAEGAVTVLAKATARRMNDTAFPTGREGEKARRGALPEEELEGSTEVVQTKEAPFYQRLHGNSKIFNTTGKEQVRDLISWPAGKSAVEFVTKMLNLKERIILFDEDTAASLIAAYQVQGTEAAKDYVTQIEGAITDDIAGRILRPSKNTAKNERVMHVFISNRAERRAVQVGESVYRYSRGLTVMHEMGHLVQYTHLDRLSPALRQKVLDSFGHETDKQNREAFANWMAKVAADINRQHKRKRTRNPEVDNIFVKIVEDLRTVWASLRRKLRYNKTFGEFVDALNSHAASQRGEAVDLTWKTPLARQMFQELEDTANGGLIPNNSVGAVAAPVVGYRGGVGAVNAAERKGEGISVLRKPGEKHFGNPFSHLPNARDARKTQNLQDSVDQYVAWLEGTAHQDYKQERRNWVLQQIDSGALAGKTLLYYSKQKPNHAEALKEFIAARTSAPAVAVPLEQSTVQFEESSESSYLVRTLQNAKGADVTIDFARTATGSGGRYGQTKQSANKAGKTYVNIIVGKDGSFNPQLAAKKIVAMIKGAGLSTASLNIAGHGIYSVGDNQAQVDALVTETLQLVNQELKIKSVRSGGQTGFDEAGAKAGVALGVPTTVLAPKGWKFRPEYRKDISDEQQFKARFEDRTYDYDDMSIEAAEEQANDSVFQSFVTNFQNWAATLKDDPAKAGKMLVYTADSELRGMGAVGTWLAKQFHALPSSTDPSNTVFRSIAMQAAPHFKALEQVLNSIPSSRIGLWEMFFNKHPSAATQALRAERKAVTEALLLQTPLDQVDESIRPHVEEVRNYLDRLYRWYTGDMNMALKRRGFKDGLPTYYPMMLDTQVIEQNRGKFIRILRFHGMTEAQAQRERQKLTRDEDGGLNNGFQGEDLSAEFLGPGATFKKARADRDVWSDALRAELVAEGFYQQDIATTLIAYTEMMTRRAVWERRFHDPRRGQQLSLEEITEYTDRGLNINHPIARLQLTLAKARERGRLTEWQYRRINEDILPAYAGQLGLRTNSHIRKLSAGIVIYQNLRLLGFAIFSQFVDVGTLAARGDFKSTQAAMQILMDRTSRAEAVEMLQAIGAMRQGLTEHVLNDQALNTFMTGKAKRINDLFFRYNLMEGWTNLMRTMGLVSGREFMQRNAQKALAGDANAIRYLAELDITPAEIVAWDGHSTGNLRINAALNRYIDEAMIRPDASIRPVWMSDPGYGVFAHLKGFLYGFHETFLRRVGREAKIHQNLLPLLMLGMLALPFAAVGYELRRKILGTSKHAPEGVGYMKELVERAGLFGAWQMVVDMEQADEYGKPFALGIGGPAVEQLFTFFDSDLSSWTPRAIPVVASVPAMREWVRDEMQD